MKLSEQISALNVPESWLEYQLFKKQGSDYLYQNTMSRKEFEKFRKDNTLYNTEHAGEISLRHFGDSDLAVTERRVYNTINKEAAYQKALDMFYSTYIVDDKEMFEQQNFETWYVEDAAYNIEGLLEDCSLSDQYDILINFFRWTDYRWYTGAEWVRCKILEDQDDKLLICYLDETWKIQSVPKETVKFLFEQKELK